MQLSTRSVAQLLEQLDASDSNDIHKIAKLSLELAKLIQRRATELQTLPSEGSKRSWIA